MGDLRIEWHEFAHGRRLCLHIYGASDLKPGKSDDYRGYLLLEEGATKADLARAVLAALSDSDRRAVLAEAAAGVGCVLLTQAHSALLAGVCEYVVANDAAGLTADEHDAHTALWRPEEHGPQQRAVEADAAREGGAE